MSTFIFPSSTQPPKTEVRKKIQQYQKTELQPKIEPPVVNAPVVETPIVSEVKKTPEQYSHILSVLIQYNTTPIKPVTELNKSILKEVAKVIHNVVHTKMLGNNFFAPIVWVQQGTVYSNKYFMNTELLGDVAVKKHTVLLLNDVVKHIDDIFDNAFSKNEIVLIFDVTKPLTRKVVLI